MKTTPTIALALGPTAWESAIVSGLASGTDPLTIRRCVDVADLISVATAQAATVIVVDAAFPRIDATIVTRAAESGVSIIGLAMDHDDATALQTMGVTEVIPVEVAQLDAVVDRLRALAGRRRATAAKAKPGQAIDANESAATITVIWGPPGAPGRTHTAIALAQFLAAEGRSVLLVDADTYSPGISESLCLEAEASGLLAAAHHAERGTLDVSTLSRLARSISPGLRVLTGIPQAMRSSELRAAPMTKVWQVAGQLCDVLIVDIGGCVEDGLLAMDADVGDFGITGTGRSPQATALTAADQLIAVASCEPPAIARLLTTWPGIRSLAPAAQTHIVINRLRAPIVKGNSATEKLIEFVAEHADCGGVHPIRDDRSNADAATAKGLTLFEHAPKSAAITDLHPLGSQLTAATSRREQPKVAAAHSSRG